MEGRLMVMVPPMGSADAVVNANVVIPVVVLCATLSPTASVRDALVTCPPIAGDMLEELTTSVLVATVKPEATASLGAPVVSCPAAKVMDCAPAGSTALAVVHTMTRVAAVITHPDNVAPADTGISVPTGEDGPVK